MTDDLTVHIASSEQLTHAYHLRYQVFSEEMKDHRYADHANRVWRDEDDIPASQVVVAIDSSGGVVGTARLTPLRLHKFIGYEVYGFDVLARLLEISEEEVRAQVARLDRVVVSKPWRGRRVVHKLVSSVEDLAWNCGSTIVVGVPGAGNRRSRVTFQRLGYRDYPVSAEYRGFIAQLIYKRLTGPIVAALSQPDDAA